MKQPDTPNLSPKPDSIALSLRAPDSPVRSQMARLSKLAPPPLDCANLSLVCRAAVRVVDEAFRLLLRPNAAALLLHDELASLLTACLAEYRRRNAVDVESGLERRLLATPAWSALNGVCSFPEGTCHPGITALGIELALSWMNNKPMAVAFCNGARTAFEDVDLLNNDLLKLMEVQEGDKLPHWIKHARTVFAEFLASFDDLPPPPPTTPKSFEEKAKLEFLGRAAFPTYRCRAGVPDDTCMSPRQIDEAMQFAGAGGFDSPAARRAALWLVGISGLFAGSTHRIPLATSAPDDWVVRYDVVTGLLYRDYRCLATDASRAQTEGCVAASFCFVAPAPRDVHAYLVVRAANTPGAISTGDLIPGLVLLQPHASLYPSLSDLIPSWARWSRSWGPLARQVGLDNFVAAAICGNLGLTARSKLYYSLLGSEEVWEACRRLYARLNFGVPVEMPRGTVNFGVTVVPSATTLRRLDTEFVADLESLRPPNRGDEGQVLKFHNRYMRVLTSRIAVWVDLREATEISIRATVDERRDACVDLFEKGSAGRHGGMPAVIGDDMRAALGNYRLHCAALYDRLLTFGWHGPVMDWLQGVIHRRDVPLLATIPSRKRAVPVGTAEVIKRLPGASVLVPDWGRKFNENGLRLLGVQTRDIDRQQRHEVQGQETNTSVADDSERAWVARIKPALNTLSRDIFKARLNGLRRTL
jgi:hypothetical protein